MKIDYEIDWYKHTPLRMGSEVSAYEIWLVKGWTKITLGKDVIEARDTCVLIDLCQIINAFSYKALSRFNGDYLAIHIDDEPVLFISYQENVQFYRYSPNESDINRNPVLNNVLREDILKEGDSLKMRVLSEISAYDVVLLDSYRSLLW
jgi:hypothetical protein